MLEKVLDLQQTLGLQIFGLLPVAVDRQDLVDRNRQQFGVAASLVFHFEQTQRAAAHNGSGMDWERRHHKHVHRIAIVRDGARHVAVVTGIVHRGHHETIDKQGARFLVYLVFDRVRVGRDLDDDVELFGRFVAGGNVVQGHSWASLRIGCAARHCTRRRPILRLCSIALTEKNPVSALLDTLQTADTPAGPDGMSGYNQNNTRYHD